MVEHETGIIAVITMLRGRFIQQVDRVPAAEHLEQSRSFESGVKLITIIISNRFFRNVFHHVMNDLLFRDVLDVDTTSWTEFHPELEKGIPFIIFTLNHNMEVNMPIRTTACDINDISSATYVSFPAGCLPEFAKTFHDGCRHKGKVLLILDRERQVLQVVTRKRFQILSEELKSRLDAHTADVAAD